MFNVGDRVRSTRSLYDGVIEEATVFKVGKSIVYVHFDNPFTERMQFPEGGWSFGTFEVIEDKGSFIPEDWS